MADQGLYYKTLTAFFAFLDTADAVTMNFQTSDLDDQMYMNPYTVDSVPDVVVMTTTDHSGYFLTYTFVIKDNMFKVSYRIDCGYQPTNVQEVMHIVPDDTPRQQRSDPMPEPVVEPTPVPRPEPTPEPKPEPTPAPDTEPTPVYNKDKTKGTQGDVVKPNDDPGPGPDTNNGAGSQTSTKDQPTNSSNFNSYDEYKEVINEMKEDNQTQKTGNDLSTPSSTGPANTAVHVDDNADKGTGNGGIDVPTPVTKPAVVAETNQPIDDSPGEAWEGPVD